jgi:hypothetical protein
MKRRDFIKGVAVYTPGLALPLVAGAGRHLSGIGTGVPPCDTTAEVDSTVAGFRETNFTKWKKTYLDGTCSGGENSIIPVVPQSFLDMLKIFVKTTKPNSTSFLYNGMRTYFAVGDLDSNNPAGIPSTEMGKLTVLFVPTKENPLSATKCGGDDDFSQCWLLNKKIPNGQYHFLDPSIPKRWIANYRAQKLPTLNAHGPSTGQFKDTKSLWYSWLSIAGGEPSGHKDCGIYGYVRDRIKSITSMNIAFGAYDGSEKPPFKQYYYQLLAQFDFTINEKTVSFGSSDGSVFFNKYKLKRLSGSTTDTGLPCPPADSCNGSIQ